MSKFNSRKLAIAIAALTAIQSNSASPTVKVVCQAVLAGLYVIVQGYVDAKAPLPLIEGEPLLLVQDDGGE